MFSKVFKYVKFILRRERLTSTLWVVLMIVCAALIAAYYPSILPDKKALLDMSATLNTPAMRAMMGPVYGLNSLSTASVFAMECLLWFMVAIVIMNIFFVTRHTRAEEEDGKAEILASLPVGRLSSSLAVIKVSFLLNLVIGFLSAVGIYLVHIDGTTFAGALAFGLALGAVGLVFAGITYLCAQLFSTARAVSAVSLVIFFILFLLRGIGDMNGNVLSKISPLGLGLQTFAFFSNNFMPILIILIESIVLFLVGFWICASRDLGAGVFPARKGRETASRFLRGPVGLTWRLERFTIIGWIIGLFAIGASYASVVPQLNSFATNGGVLQQMIDASGGNSMVDNYFAMILIISALVASIPIIVLINRLVSEEKRGKIEQVLAKPISRVRQIMGYIVMAFVSSIVFPFICALGLWGASGVSASEFSKLICGAYAYMPALWVVLGFGVLLVGLLPKLTSLSWVLFAFSFCVVYFGRIINVPNWVARIAPFGNVPQMPVASFAWPPMIVLTIIALVLAALGVIGYSKRDLI